MTLQSHPHFFVPYQPLKNYLRTVRRRYGFSQDEIALLLGATSGTKVSRYETFTRLPSISTVFAYEVIFGAAARDLFAGAYQDVRCAVVSRAKLLMESLNHESADPEILRKVQFLRSIVEKDARADAASLP
jgi:transcriptional regulator with XRE-family HTH domain